MNQNAGIFEYITEDYVLAGVKQDLGIVDTNIHDLYLLDNINLGLKELKAIGATQTYCVAQLKVEDFKCKLPKNFIRFTKKNPLVYVNAAGQAIGGVDNQNYYVVETTADGALLGTQTVTGSNLWPRYSAPVFINNAFFKDSPYNQSWNLTGTVNLVDGWLIFSDDVVAQYVKIAYVGTNVDENGRLLIPQFIERYLRAFAATRFCRTHFTTHGAVMPSYEREMKKAKAECKARAAMPDSLEYEFINYVYNTLC